MLHEIKISIGNPIGNLYRARHVLVLISDGNDHYLLGEKPEFYPAGMARMVGGGIEEREHPVDAACRELDEELSIRVSPEQLSPLVEIRTVASTREGPMAMTTWVYALEIAAFTDLRASSDIQSLRCVTGAGFRRLIARMERLTGEFRAPTFRFNWCDWGRIYGEIHRIALAKYLVTRQDRAPSYERSSNLRGRLPDDRSDSRSQRRAA